MIYKIIYSDRAYDTFDSIKKQVFNRWGQKHRDDFVTRTLHTIGLISTAPFRYPIVNADMNLRRSVIHRNCSLFYEVTPGQVIIHFFWDNRQEPLF